MRNITKEINQLKEIVYWVRLQIVLKKLERRMYGN